ncbi:MAG: PHP domain-containing protein [bacterium]
MSFNAIAAEHLHQIARMMELLGEDGFRVLAHSKGARVLEGLADDLGPVAKLPAAEARKRLTAVEGIGPKIADKLIELASSGRISELDALREKVPQGLLELLRAPGLGPKTVRMFWQEAGVTDVAGLKRIIADGSILNLPRMGAKAVEKISASLALLDESDKRLALGPAWAFASALVARVKAMPGVSRAAFAGSLRRGRDTVGDIDVLACAADPAAVSAAFRALPEVRTVLTAGDTRASVRMAVNAASRWDAASSEDGGGAGRGGGGGEGGEGGGQTVQVDLRLVDESQWGAALMYFTGSKDFNVAMRQRALSMGLTLNEYGLFPEDGTTDEAPHKRGIKPVAGRSEAEIFSKLGMVEVPPEIREGQAALELKAVPRLVEVGDIKAELHAHTTASDGVLSIAELAAAAKARGFHTLAVTDHSQSQPIANGLKPARLRKHIADVRAEAAKLTGFTLLAGSEVDILSDGRLDYDDDLLAELDVVVASPHVALSQAPEVATERLLAAAKHRLVHIIGHPTGRLVLRRTGLDPDFKKLIAAAKANNVALEINSHWMRLDLRDVHVRAAVDAGCLIAIDCDVHHPEDFETLHFGVTTGRRGWLPPELCVNTWPAAKLRDWLKSKR